METKPLIFDLHGHTRFSVIPEGVKYLPNRKCKEPYMGERDLIKELLRVIKDLKDSQLIITDKLKIAMREYGKIIMEANYLSKYNFDGEFTTRDCIEYIIREGSMKVRRDLIESIPIPKLLYNRTLI